jgi:ADP-ribosyl-[dinitrogen reductase] hydrolase
MSTSLIRRRRLEGCLLGTAVGDALGLPCEGLRGATVRRRFLPLNRYRLVGRTGYVSDDTEQSALVAQALCATLRESEPANDDVVVERAVKRFRRSLLGWFLRLPFGVGFATVRACLKLLLGVRRSGVNSAGNGAAMRSMIVGAWLNDANDRPLRVRVARALAEVTHTDPRAVAAAVFVADVAAHDARALSFVEEPELQASITRAVDLAERGVDVDEAAQVLGTSGFVLHSVPFSFFCLKRFGPHFSAVQKAIEAGGDADTHAAIVGGWVGALQPDEIPRDLVAALAGGPFGATHLRALAAALDEGRQAPSYLWPLALLRNLALYPVVVAHGLRRLLPW